MRFPFVTLVVVAVLFTGLLAVPTLGARTAAPLTARLEARLSQLAPGKTVAAWVYFTDKETADKPGTRVRSDLVSARSLERRRKVRPEWALVDRTDLPVADLYVREVAARVERLRKRSKWFNAVSVEATAQQLEALRGLPFVRQIDLLVRFRRSLPGTPGDDLRLKAAPEPAGGPAPLPAPRSTILDYGASFNQLEQISVPALHDMGFNGAGVVIGHFDNGHRLLTHEAFATMNIVATHDFVDGDTDPAPDPGDPTNFGAHGVVTLSVLGGFKEGRLIGPAYGAAYLLARTEDDASETPVEEDNWVAAIEWADSIGVDVTSTSLAYLNYDAPFTSWTWQDMDGNTTVITRAADMAVARGIVVVNSAGNSGAADSTHNTLLAPADGDSVLTVGAVDSIGTRTGFSSIGPTFDGRIKPDLMARGRLTRAASAAGTSEYFSASGTSLSCPLVAGVAALLLSANPAATPMQIRDALRNTASQAGAPDNFMGWGVIDALAAHQYLQSTAVGPFAALPGIRLAPISPNPFNPGTVIRYELPAHAHVLLRVFDVRGRLVRTLVAGEQVADAYAVTWRGATDDGREAASGTYFVQLRADAVAGAAQRYVATQKITLAR